MKYWLVATYKINEVKRLEQNLVNQKFSYYIPKITLKKVNSRPKKELLFPGYIFINTDFQKYSALKYTIGIKNIIKFGNRISYISDEEIKSIQMAEEASKLDPVVTQIKIGQEAIIKNGSLKGNIVKICSLSSHNRVGVFMYFLGGARSITVPKKILSFK